MRVSIHSGGPPGASELRAFLARRDAEHDWRLARETLEEDGNLRNHTLAALVLLEFPFRDGTYWLLSDALRFPANSATRAARLALGSLTRAYGRDVDWGPAEATLDAVLGGTNLFAFHDLLRALQRTSVDPALAGKLVRRNPHVFRAKLGSRIEFQRRPVIEFLHHATGEGLGDRPEAWLERLRRTEG